LLTSKFTTQLDHISIVKRLCIKLRWREHPVKFLKPFKLSPLDSLGLASMGGGALTFGGAPLEEEGEEREPLLLQPRHLVRQRAPEAIFGPRLIDFPLPYQQEPPICFHGIAYTWGYG